MIKILFGSLDNLKRVLSILKVMTIIKRGMVGNNTTIGPNQYAFYSQCLTGQALSKFYELAQNAGVETVAHIATVLRGIHEFSMVNEPILSKTCYIHNYTRKPIHASTRQYVGVVCNINNYLTKSPPN